jgi:hypothetical protein
VDKQRKKRRRVKCPLLASSVGTMPGTRRGNYAGYKRRMLRDPDKITQTKSFGDWFKEKYPGETMPKR